MVEEITCVSCGTFSDYVNAQQYGCEESTLMFCRRCNSPALNIQNIHPAQWMMKEGSQMGLNELGTSLNQSRLVNFWTQSPRDEQYALVEE